MSQAERLYRLKNLLDSGRCLQRSRLLADLGISPATLKRDIAHLRDRMNAPVVWDRDQGGYRLDASQALVGTQYEWPGLWLSAEEIHALLTMQHHPPEGDFEPPVAAYIQ
jgi:predicted DNA-binding transcriptional regulator YafY